jgi:hypothetical protein
VIFRYPDRVPLTHFVHRAKKFLACGPEFSVEFSAAPEFSGGETEKSLSTGWARAYNLPIMRQECYHCATASLRKLSYGIHCAPSWYFPAFSVVSGSRIFRPNLVVTCQNFPAVSVVTCLDFLALPFPARECKKSPSRDQKAGIFRPYLLFLARIFRP